ncbi:DUF418 domain-containing protein [Corynebacterium pygosceleis]|uniref:DUF418 domain-containing protein n=1 Tax=Corynebacterium pygosceleis TaxID=2800406 RepID=A0A9Q4GHR9_9CORY|nr:DUF418 domain-containing protein [Corynebacterium pygosceleis]MCK7636890.1 DUF418 domain-containing protein [Corynebacterium pygosceleis]MCK7674364.1 DUF418 domain-containing protein [Corynebacterium pygosceleis]MCL0120338.1 DUF418 domain-containing protein [Corynebacterium pygosceleis]MCX7467643.1 DUF418 domain-containing protein [Corynebacterium pygosceleis]
MNPTSLPEPPGGNGPSRHHGAPASTVPPRARLVSPDLARGLMLLGIAIANITSTWLAPLGDEPDLAASAGGIADGGLLDRIAVVFGALFIHVRGIAMFSTLLGYGFGLLALSLWRRSYPLTAARGVLARRYGILAAFGAVHTVVFYYGDIMTFYGVTGVLLALLLPLRDRTLLIIAAVLQAIALLFIVPMIMFSSEFDMHGSLDFGSYGEYVATGGIILIGSLFMFPAEAAMVAPVIIVGFVAARKGVLTHPERHLRALWSAVGVAVAVIVLVGLPWGLSMAGWAPASWAPRLEGVNAVVGMFTGPGLVAAIALGSLPLQRKIDAARAAGNEHRPGFCVRALIALGRRSMTGYVLQSVLCVVFLASFGLHLVTPGSAAAGTATGLVVWLVTVVIAVALERLGLPGPLEWLHRRLAYGRTGLPRRWEPPVSRSTPAVDDREPGTPPGH